MLEAHTAPVAVGFAMQAESDAQRSLGQALRRRHEHAVGHNVAARQEGAHGQARENVPAVAMEHGMVAPHFQGMPQDNSGNLVLAWLGMHSLRCRHVQNLTINTLPAMPFAGLAVPCHVHCALAAYQAHHQQCPQTTTHASHVVGLAGAA